MQKHDMTAVLTPLIDAESIHQQLKQLEHLGRDALLVLWQLHVTALVPKYCGLTFMRQAIAWHIQCKAYGGLSAGVRRRLKHQRSTQLPKGGVLVRVWQDQTHQVRILENSFEYGGKHYRSLSAIAKAITGTAWSGPKFFGITD